MAKETEFQTENLIIGSGLAGLYLALKLAEAKQSVLIISKGDFSESNSFYAQGGIASVLHHDDSFDQHVNDTLQAGAGLCHTDVVRLVVESGPAVIKDLLQWGVSFTKLENGTVSELHLTREGGHSHRRVVHSQDMTGRAIMNALIRHASTSPYIRIMDQHAAIDLLTTDKCQPDFTSNICLGAYVLSLKSGKIVTVKSAKTYLCTGGHGRLYLYTSNPSHSTGDGLAIGWRAGCKVANLEFMQFHPTCLFHPKARNFLISEALRGEGAVLRDTHGREFMQAYHPSASLAPRDIVARAIDFELKKTGEDKVYLDATPMGARVRDLFPNIAQTCAELGIDISRECIPVVPAAHYSCGGLVTDSFGQTNIRHLYALGEVACNGLHGANRLASNSLLEACVMASRAAENALAETNDKLTLKLPHWRKGKAIPTDEGVVLSNLWDEIRRLMWHYVGIVRSEKRLKRAMRRIIAIQNELDEYYWNYEVDGKLLEVRNLSQVAFLTVRCAISRKESRGIHYNIDYPEQSPEWQKDTVIW